MQERKKTLKLVGEEGHSPARVRVERILPKQQMGSRRQSPFHSDRQRASGENQLEGYTDPHSADSDDGKPPSPERLPLPASAHEQRVMEILTELQRQSADLLQEVKFIGGRLKKLEESPVDRYSRHLYPREEYAMCALDEIVTLLELPLTTMEMFENSEKTLKESSETRFALQQKLSRFGGVAVKEVVRDIVNGCMVNRIQLLFSMHGRKGKAPFRSTALCDVMIGAIQSRLPAENLRTIERTISRHLIGAVDRDGGRKERRK